jgi:GT2 family glycosyltransferase
MQVDYYKAWIEQIEPGLQSPVLTEQMLTFSILMPVYRAEITHLDAAIKSLREQSYERWELCLYDDASESPELIEAMQSWQKSEPRIRLALGKENLGIAEATNQCRAMAKGDYLVLMDQDDLLPPHALNEVASAIASNPNAGLIYSDEDKLDECGQRHAPHFKPDYNRTLLLSQNYICHLLTLRRELFDQINGLRGGYDGAQDHDLILRAVAQLQPEQILHIPQILYHWRVHASSTASSLDAKPEALEAGRKVIADHLVKKQRPAQVSLAQIRYRVSYDVAPEPDVTIIIPTRNGIATLKRCINSIRDKTAYENYQIVVVDNGSDDFSTLNYLKALSAEGIKIIVENSPFNFSQLNNIAVAASQSELVCLLNDDTEVIEGNWLTVMVGEILAPEVGAVGAKLLYDNDTVQHGGVILGIGGVAGHAHKHFSRDADGYFSRLQCTQNLSAVTAACMLVKREVWQAVGGMTEQLAVAFNDVDLCLKITQSGWEIVWTPWAELYHHESISRGYETTPEKQARFRTEEAYMHEVWRAHLEHDPFYNPHLTRSDESFYLKSPSEYQDSDYT